MASSFPYDKADAAPPYAPPYRLYEETPAVTHSHLQLGYQQQLVQQAHEDNAWQTHLASQNPYKQRLTAAHDQELPDSKPRFPEDAAESNEELAPQDAEEVAASLSWIPAGPPPSYESIQSRLQRIVAIPQVAPNTLRSGPMPYLRAYAPDLASHHVTVKDFVAFIDGLTVAQAPSPPVQAVQAAGKVIGFVPHHWAQLASMGIGVASGAGSAAISITRAKAYIKGANARYFGPRGLKATVLKDGELTELLRYPHARSLAPVDRDTGCLTVTDRRLAALAPYIAQLTLDVPPPALPHNVIDKISAKSIQRTLRKTRQGAEEKAAESEKKHRKKEKEREKKDHEREKKERKKEEEREKKRREKRKKNEKRGRSSSSISSSSSASSSSEKNVLRSDAGASQAHGEQTRPRSRSSSADKHEGDDLKKAAKLRWIVVQNL